MANKKYAAALSVGVTCAVLLSGCASSDGGTAGGDDRSAEDFPSSEFPGEVYGNLQGPLVWYDGSGGATTQARDDTYFKDFTTLTGVTLQPDFGGTATKFFSAAEAGADIPWSVIEFSTYGEYIKARDSGLLEPIDTAKVPVDQLEPGSYDEFGFKSTRYGIGLAYNHEVYPESGEHPTSNTDIFDTQRFPGKRCMYKYPQYGGTLEVALLADGVPADQLYPLDVDRALRKLDTIKNDILWWSDGDTASRMLTSGECDLGMVWSGRAFTVAAQDGVPLTFVWDDAVYTDGAIAVPKGATNPDAGMALMAMTIQDRQGQIDFVNKIGYPTPISSIALDDYSEEAMPWIPAGDNLATAVEEDSQYYADNITELVDVFNRWVTT